MRAVAVAVLSLVAVACGLFVQTMSYVGGAVTDSDRFADLVLRAVATDAGSAAVAATVADALEAQLRAQNVPLTPGVRDAVQSQLTQSLRETGVTAPLRPGVVAAHRTLLDADGGDAPIPLAPLRPQVLEIVTQVAPAAVVYVPPASAFPTVRVPVGPDVRAPLQAAAELRGTTPYIAVLGLVCLGVAITLAGRRDRLLTALGVAACVLAVVPPVAWFVTTRAARVLSTPSVEPLAEAVAEELTTGWGWAAGVTLLVGGALLVTGGVVARTPLR